MDAPPGNNRFPYIDMEAPPHVPPRSIDRKSEVAPRDGSETQRLTIHCSYMFLALCQQELHGPTIHHQWEKA